jgi:FkbM family methyltransferase
MKTGVNKNIIYDDKYKIHYRPDIDNFDVIEEVMLTKNYFEKGFSIAKNSCVIDIGANIGCFSILAAKNAKQVFAFEPEKNTYEILKLNLKENGLNNVIVQNIAVSDKSGDAYLNIFKNNAALNSMCRPSKDKQIIKTISLKEVFDNNQILECDFLKIDTEGMEYAILEGLSKEYYLKINKIVLEYHNFIKKHDAFNIICLLSRLGYSVDVIGNTYQGTVYARKTGKIFLYVKNLHKYMILIYKTDGKFDRFIEKTGIFFNQKTGKIGNCLRYNYPKVYKFLKPYFPNKK